MSNYRPFTQFLGECVWQSLICFIAHFFNTGNKPSFCISLHFLKNPVYKMLCWQTCIPVANSVGELNLPFISLT